MSCDCDGCKEDGLFDEIWRDLPDGDVNNDVPGGQNFRFTSVKTKQGKEYSVYDNADVVVGVFDEFGELIQVDVAVKPDYTKSKLIKTTIVIPTGNVAELKSEIEVEDTRSFVQVRFLDGINTEKFYTYTNPGLDLLPGDIVLVDTVYGPNNEAEVVSLSKGSLHQGSYKTVKARLTFPAVGTPDLSALALGARLRRG